MPRMYKNRVYITKLSIFTEGFRGFFSVTPDEDLEFATMCIANSSNFYFS
jgi:hypothetical protein